MKIHLLSLLLCTLLACTGSDKSDDSGGGSDGADGTDGTDGTDGSDGTDGGDGSDGSDGTDGGEIHAEEINDLGCGEPASESLTATSTTAGRIDVTHIDYLDGCCPEAVEVAVMATGSTLEIEYTLVNDFCECICALDVSYALVDVPSGTWTLEAGPSGTTATVSVP